MQEQQAYSNASRSVFIINAKEDQKSREDLEKHLSHLNLSIWSLDRISPGARRKLEIDKQLHEASLILLFISVDFLASDLCIDLMERVLKTHKNNVVPIIISDCDWKKTPLNDLQVLPKDGKPVMRERDRRRRDRIWYKAAEGIQAALKQSFGTNVYDTARIQYLKNISEKYSSVKLPTGLGTLNKSFSLKAVLQPLKRRQIPLKESKYSDESSYRLQVPIKEQSSGLSDHLFLDEFARDGEEALNKSPQRRMIVLGGPGSGKTTLLRFLVSEYAKRATEDLSTPIPFFISLPRFAVSGKTLIEYILSTMQDMFIDEYSAINLCKKIREGHALICLDGLDEVIDKRQHIISQIHDLISYTENMCIISSRFTHFTTGEQLDHQTFTLWELLPLNDAFRSELAQRLQTFLQPEVSPIAPQKFEASKFLDALDKDNKVEIWGRTPLLFSLTAMVFAHTGELPSTNVELYDQVAEEMLQAREPDASRMARGILHHALAALALELYLQHKGRFFTSKDLAYILPEIRKNLEETWNTEEMSHRIINCGILETTKHDSYNFIHQTFQEYLAADYVKSLSVTKSEEIIDALIDDIGLPTYRQVLVATVHLAHLQKDALENTLYRKLLLRLGSAKIEMRNAHGEGHLHAPSTISWGITYLLQDLFSYWDERLYFTLEEGSANCLADGEIASTIGSVIEAHPQDNAVPSLVESLYKYEKKARFIGALGKIGTEEAKDALLRFTTEQIADPKTDPSIFQYLFRALEEARVYQVMPLLNHVQDSENFEKEAKKAACHALSVLEQGVALRADDYDLEEIYASLSLNDEKERPSDWKRVEAMASWLQQFGSQSQLVQLNFPEILVALEKALNHVHDGARKAVVRALGMLGNSQTFDYLGKWLAKGNGHSQDIAMEILTALIQLVERSYTNLTVQKIETMFSRIEYTHPMLKDEVMRTKIALQRYLEEKQHE